MCVFCSTRTFTITQRNSVQPVYSKLTSVISYNKQISQLKLNHVITMSQRMYTILFFSVTLSNVNQLY